MSGPFPLGSTKLCVARTFLSALACRAIRQLAAVKLQIPMAKCQNENSKHQIPNGVCLKEYSSLVIKRKPNTTSSLSWFCLVFGYWNLVLACWQARELVHVLSRQSILIVICELRNFLDHFFYLRFRCCRGQA